MSKKRKTRKQKEKAQLRQPVVIPEEPRAKEAYSVVKSAKPAGERVKATEKPVSPSESSYIRKDLIHIASASGIIVAFNLLLAVLLFTSTVKLNFLGY